ncbi:TMhelix containing protein [Vibrio phage 150E35-1]|nr:TMhelix containing protein [Vibrio phage 150E35-1]
MYLTSIRNSMEDVDYRTLKGFNLIKMILFDVIINAGHAVSGGIIARMIFELGIMQQYKEYTLLGIILIGVSFKELLPVVTGVFKRVVSLKVNNLDK